MTTNEWFEEQWERLEKEEIVIDGDLRAAIREDRETNFTDQNLLIVKFPNWEAKKDFIGKLENITRDPETNYWHEHFGYRQVKPQPGLSFTLPEEGWKNYSEQALFELVWNHQHLAKGYRRSKNYSY